MFTKLGKTQVLSKIRKKLSTYGAKTKPEISKTKQQVATTEITALRCVTGKTLRDKLRKKRIREQYKSQDIRKYMKARKRDRK